MKMLLKTYPEKTLNKIDFNESFFETIDSEEKAYWLGFIAADGCLSLKIYKMTLSQAEKDLNHLIKFQKSIDSNHKLCKRINKKQNTISYNLLLHSKKMYNDLVDKGITPRKSLTLKPPLNVPENLIQHWIRGYFDGDGSVHIRKSKNTLRFSITGTKEVLEFINLQNNSFLRVHDSKRSKAKKIEGSSLKTRNFLHYIYDDSAIFLDRKKNLFQNYITGKFLIYENCIN